MQTGPCFRQNLRHLLWVTAIGLVSIIGTSAARAAQAVTDFYVGAPPTQMYVQHWEAKDGEGRQAEPIIMIHGGSHTGTAWTTTPDGRPGFAPQLADQGWQVYVVDWPGMGRSGAWPESLAEGPETVVADLVALLDRVGPAVLMGHSIGGGLSFKVAEQHAEKVRAIVALAPAAVEGSNDLAPARPLDRMVIAPRQDAMDRFANADMFPKESFDNYYAGLVPYPPRIRNAAAGATNELKLDRSRLAVWKQVPVLFLCGEQDKTVPDQLSQTTADLMGVHRLLLGRDWNMPGHGHLFPVDKGNEQIAGRINEWLSTTLKGR